MQEHSRFINYRGYASGDHICMPVKALVTRIKNLDWWKSSLIAWSLHSEVLDCLILWEFKGQEHSHASLVSEKVHWSGDISRSEFVLIPWLAPKSNVDCLIPFWSQSQTLLQATRMWLPLGMQMTLNCHFLVNFHYTNSTRISGSAETGNLL